jgi:hypothetical protein
LSKLVTDVRFLEVPHAVPLALLEERIELVDVRSRRNINRE